MEGGKKARLWTESREGRGKTWEMKEEKSSMEVGEKNSGKKGKKNEHRIEFDLNDFFVEKLNFENGKLYFGSNARVDEVAKAIGIDVEKAIKDCGLEKGADHHHILDDEQIAELSLNNHIEFEKVDDISPVNVVDKILTIMESQQ